MAASLTLQSGLSETGLAYVEAGQSPVLVGKGFAANSPVTITQADYAGQLQWVAESDGAGSFSVPDVAAHAVGTLTVSGAITAAETVTVGGKTYTWRASVSTTANEVLIGGTVAASIQNLADAINANPATSGTAYGSATTANANVSAYNVDATHLYVEAIAGGTAGNSIASTETMVNGAWGAGTLSGGAAGDGLGFQWIPERPGTYIFSATDGTNTAKLTVRVWSN